jgi:NAD(P)H-hydrate epimerase
MERAGSAVAHGGDARFSSRDRVFACVWVAARTAATGASPARVLREAGHVADEVEDGLDDYDVVVDALFGTGFHGAPRQEAAAIVERINASAAAVVSVDLPSGVDASTGEVAGAVVDADLTVTFHAPKVGLAIGPGRFHAGRVVVADIGLDDAPTEIRRVRAAILDAVPRRGTTDTKYSAGAVVVVGGQPGMTGAACLTAMAALRADAGYVTLAGADRVARDRRGDRARAGEGGAGRTTTPVETIASAAERARALAIGPGLGRGFGSP